MKDSNGSKVVEQQESGSSSRRKFLIKTSAGVVITTLPAHSVWGACNASGLSGGSRGADPVCIIPLVKGGRSPGSWKVFVDTTENNVATTQSNNGQAKKVKDEEQLEHNKVREMFSLSKFDDLDAAYCSVRSEIARMQPVVLSDGTGTIPFAELNIKEALENSGGIWNLAAYYLNAYFGFYGDISPFNSAQEMVQHVWGVLYVNNNNSVPTDYDQLTSSFTDGSTSSDRLPSATC